MYKKGSACILDGKDCVDKLLNIIDEVETTGDVSISIHAKFQEEGAIEIPLNQPNKLVVIYDSDEQSTPTCFDDYETAKIYLSCIDVAKIPHRIHVKLK